MYKQYRFQTSQNDVIESSPESRGTTSGSLSQAYINIAWFMAKACGGNVRKASAGTCCERETAESRAKKDLRRLTMSHQHESHFLLEIV